MLQAARGSASGSPPPRPSRLGRALGGLAALLLLAVAAALPALLPVYRLPEPSGLYPVGVTRFDWLDAGRPETLTADPDDYRELVVRAWYPASPQPGDRLAPYWPDISAGGPAMMNNWHFPTFITGHLRLVKTHSYQDAAVAGAAARFPVLFFSHGYGAIDESKNTVQMEELASHGYIIFSINHPYESLAAIYDDGRAATLSEQARDNLRHTSRLHGRIDDWVNDTLFVMGQAELLQSGEIPSPLAGRLDLERQGVFGFSFGGATAAVVCLADPRCEAGANLDGSLWGDRITQEPLEKPFLFFDSAESAGKNDDVFRMALGPVYNARIAASKHVNFSDICGWSPVSSLSGLCGRIEPRRMGGILNAYLLAFFDEYLRGEASALLDGPAKAFPEVDLHARNYK